MRHDRRPFIEALEPRAYLTAAVGEHASLSHVTDAAALVAAPAPSVEPRARPAFITPAYSVAGVAMDNITSIPYRLFVPQLTSSKQKVPLILYMHGLGDGGTDNTSQTYWAAGLLSATSAGPDEAIVLAPQLPSGWIFGYAGNHPPVEGMNLTMIALKQAMKNPHVDLSRIYVTGVSMGAYGVWDLLARFPTMFAAGVPMSYPGDPAMAKSVAKTPLWAFQGSSDTTQPPAGMRTMIASIVAAGGTPWYTEIGGGGHQIWDGVYAMPSLYAWMFAQHRGKK